MPKCIVLYCPNWTGNKLKNPTIVLHGFPKNLEMIKKWLLQTRQDFGDLDIFAQQVLEGNKNASYRLCSAHFTSDSYARHGCKMFLKKDAIPTVFRFTNPAVGYTTETGPPLKKLRLDTSYEQVSTGTPFIPILINASTQTNLHVRNNGTQTSGREGTKRVGCQTGMKRYTIDRCIQTINIGDWQQKKLPTVRMKGPLQKDTFSSQLKLGTKMSHFRQGEQPKSSLACSLNNTIITSDLEPTGLSPQCKLEKGSTISIIELEEVKTALKPEHGDEDIPKKRRFLVSESCLDQLFYKVRCGSGFYCTCTVDYFEKRIVGSFMSVTGRCSSGHTFEMWHC